MEIMEIQARSVVNPASEGEIDWNCQKRIPKSELNYSWQFDKSWVHVCINLVRLSITNVVVGELWCEATTDFKTLAGFVQFMENLESHEI